jgi:hypothetical protein
MKRVKIIKYMGNSIGSIILYPHESGILLDHGWKICHNTQNFHSLSLLITEEFAQFIQEE